MAQYSMDDLLTLMARLRDPEDGCPWDIKQTFKSVVPHTLEEVYELIDTIENNDFEHLKEELGDVLFQVVFYAQLGNEQGLFGLDDVVDALVAKLLRRHPHVFPDGSLASRATEQTIAEQQVKANWERIKQQERDDRAKNGVFDDIALAIPALSRSLKIQKRAAKEGFDWPDAAAVVPKVAEELSEVVEAVEHDDADAVEDELGDLLFAVTNLARKLNVDPEVALRRANNKFSRRFEAMGNMTKKQGYNLSDLDLSEMNLLWNRVKKEEK